MTIEAGQKMYAADILNLTFFPKGAILTFSSTAWGATSAEFKNIWKICNTANHQADPNVPDLTNRFLRGGASSDFTTGGGADSYSVFLAETNLPSHNHEVTNLSVSGTSISGLSIKDGGGAHTHSGGGTTTAEGGGHTHSVSGSTTSGEGTHAHTITDPGHAHNVPNSYYSNNGSGLDGDDDSPRLATYQNKNCDSSKTGITIATTTGAHVHNFSGNTTPTSNGTHSHNLSVTISGEGTHSHSITGGSITGGSVSGSTANTGSGTAFSVNTVPAYYTVIYIMKVV